MSKDESVAIERLVLDVGGKKVELTVDQAKRLHGALAELFADKSRVERHDHYHDWPWKWTNSLPYYQCSNGMNMRYDSKDSTLSCNL